MQNFRACLRRLGAFPLNLQRLGASPPDPHWPPAAGGSAPRPPKQPPLRISGYAPVHVRYLVSALHRILTETFTLLKVTHERSN